MSYSVADIMVTTLARCLQNGQSVFHGVASPVPMVAIRLARAMHAPELVYVNIAGGVNSYPDPLLPSTDGPNMLSASHANFGLVDIFDLSARGMLDVAFLSGAQVDESACINSSCIGPFARPKVRLPGGAGSAALVPTAKRVLVWRTKHNQKSIVQKCDFATSQGNVDLLVTPLCVFKKVNGKLQLFSIHPTSSLEEVKAQTGFAIADKAYPQTKAPTADELAMLDKIDPAKIRLVEF